MKITLITSLLMDYAGGALRPFSMDKIRSCPPYGMYLLATQLRSRGHDVVLVDLIAQGNLDLTPYAEDILTSGLIGISATSLSWPTAVDIIYSVKNKFPRKPLVLGGVHATMFDEYLLTRFPIDYIIRGEGEIALPLLAEAMEENRDVSTVPNLSAIVNERIMRTALHPPIKKERMCDYPIPDYSTLPEGIYKGIAIESSRGCPFDCSFCSTVYRRSWRGMAPERIVARIEEALPYCRKTKLGSMQIVDDEFTAHSNRAIRVGELLSKKNIDVPLIFDARANDMNKEGVIEALAPHVFRFLIGAECGYDEGLSRIGKGTTCKKIERAASLIQKYGLGDSCDFSFIIGFPWETKEEVMKTIRFACGLYANYGVRIILQWFYLIPGSSLWDQAAGEGEVNVSFYDNYGFFRNPHLFFKGVKLTPDEIWEITDSLLPVISLSKINDFGDKHIKYSIPPVVNSYFNKTSLRSEFNGALANLQSLSENVRKYNLKA